MPVLKKMACKNNAHNLNSWKSATILHLPVLGLLIFSMHTAGRRTSQVYALFKLPEMAAWRLYS